MPHRFGLPTQRQTQRDQQRPEQVRDALDAFARVVDQTVTLDEVGGVPIRDVGVVDLRLHGEMLEQEDAQRGAESAQGQASIPDSHGKRVYRRSVAPGGSSSRRRRSSVL
jgi:hypothetical protein